MRNAAVTSLRFTSFDSTPQQFVIFYPEFDVRSLL